MIDNYQILIRKLEEFIRKYYRNQLIKGLILFSAVLFFSVLVISLVEYFGHFRPLIRTLLFYLFVIVNAAVAGFYIVVPLLKLRRIGNVISHEQAAKIIGKHFPEVSDKLLNTLQLRKTLDSGEENIELLKAGIDQKIFQLRPIPFLSAIDFKKNRKFLRYALPPLLIIMIILLFSPGVLTKPTERIIYHTRTFTEPAPFNLEIQNKNLESFQQEDFVLKVKVSGKIIPDEVSLERDGITFRMNKENRILFSYTFKKVQKNEKFRLSAGNFTSEDFELKVFPKPVIIDYQVSLSYPAYTGRQAEVLENTGDLIIPEGTNIKWLFFTRDADAVIISFDDAAKQINREKSNTLEYTSVFGKSTRYSVKALNSFVRTPDSLVYSITVIPDAYPSILVQEEGDSAISNRLFFQGVIKDDYGFSKLTMYYTLFYLGDTTQKESHSEIIPVSKNINQQNFFYSLDIRRFTQNPGDALEYYFEICDNDGIHGPKCAKTGLFSYKTPSIDEIEDLTDKQEENMTNAIEQSIKEAKQIQKQIEELNKKLVEKTELSWQEKQQVKELLTKQEKIKDNIEKIQNETKKKNELEQQYNEYDQSIVEKQQQLEELFNEVMNEEMKKMMEEMQKLIDKIDKKQVSEMLEKMKMSNKDIEKQLDRNLEIFKQLEFEKKMSETIEKLNELSQKQDKLAESTNKEEMSAEQLQKEQEDLKNQFEQVKEDVEALEKRNSELEEPNNLPDLKQEEEEVLKEMKDAQESLENKNNKTAGKSQKKASQKMQQMADKMEQSQSESESEQQGEDVEKLRGILENLVRVSFSQEDLMNRTKNINRNDPKYLNVIQQQNDLKDDISMIEDSLYALAKRQPMIKPFIMREAATINQNISGAVKNLNDRNIPGASAKQQFVMTSVNNLALLLNEAMKQMESNMQMQMQSKGSGSCSKPGGKPGGKTSMKSMRQMQEQLNKQMQDLKDGMQGKPQGSGKPGEQGQKGMSEKLARMAAEQEAIRSQMKKYADQLNEEGDFKEGSGANQSVKEMEQTEKDLVNKRILQETIDRQQKILTRMLESEKAEQKREQEERRKSTEAKNEILSNPFTEIQYNRLKNQSTDMLKTVQPAYNFFYKNKITSYFLKFDK